MCHNPDDVYNQYSLRKITFPYVSSQYITTEDGQPSSSTTMQLKYHAIKVTTEMASMLSSALLLPWSRARPNGVRYDRIITPTLVLWGKQDNMMPENQRYRYEYLISERVDHQRIENAGHFAATDQPDAVAESILNWCKATFGKRVMEPFFGFTGIWKGDEKELYEGLMTLWMH